MAALSSATGAKRAAIEKAAAKVGGKKALDVVVADLKSEDAGVTDSLVDTDLLQRGSVALAGGSTVTGSRLRFGSRSGAHIGHAHVCRGDCGG